MNRLFYELQHRWEKWGFHQPTMRRNVAQHTHKLQELKRKLTSTRTPLIAIGQTQRMGDIVALEPVARQVRELYPEAHLCWAVLPSYRELIDTNPYIDTTLDVPCMTAWFRLADSGVFDKAYSLHFDDDTCSICYERRATVTGRGINESTYYHLGALLPVSCLAAELPRLEVQPRVYLSESHVMAVDALKLPDRYIVVHAEASVGTRNWKPERWHQLAEHLNQRGLPLVEIGVSPILCQESSRAGEGRCYNLCGKLSILETAEVIRRAGLYIGVDSGPAHLANAVETPGVILLGHYLNYKRYMPYTGGYADGSHATLVWAEGPASELTLEEVWQAVEQRLQMPACRETHKALQ